MRILKIVGLGFTLGVVVAGCGGDDESPSGAGAASGKGGALGVGGGAASGGSAPAGGASGTNGASGGPGGSSGAAGTSGAAGVDGGGTSGAGGAAGDSGTVGTAGTTGAGGTAGSGGAAATGGTGGTADAGPCKLAARWQVVDDYVRSPGEPSNVASITADSNGNVYAVGLARQGTFAGIVRRSTDGGRTWSLANWGTGLPNDAAADDAGNVYVTAGDNGPVLRKSSDRGMTWVDLNRIPPGTSTTDPCNTGFVATGPRDILVFGASCDSTGWVVRRSVDAGRTFQPAFTFQLASGKPARLQDVAVIEGDAYAIGNAAAANDAMFWVVARGSGMVSDQFALAANQLANGRGFGGKSRLLATGFASDGQTTFGVVRRKDPAPGGWTTIDRFATRAIDVEQVGDQIIVAGTVDQGGVERVVTRRSDDGGATFKPLDDYAYAAGMASSSSALTSDPRGNVYAAIGGRDSAGANHWVIRKLTCE
jgi:hypothetical protein